MTASFSRSSSPCYAVTGSPSSSRTPPAKWPLMEDVTADFVYVRLHGDKKLYESGYSDAALDGWAARIRTWLRGNEVKNARTVSDSSAPRRASREVFVYFDNDVKVHAPFDAMRLAEKIIG